MCVASRDVNKKLPRLKGAGDKGDGRGNWGGYGHELALWVVGLPIRVHEQARHRNRNRHRA